VNERLNAVIGQQKAAEQIASLIGFVEGVLVLDYGKMDPLTLSTLYRQAADTGQFDEYKAVVRHINAVNGLAPSFIADSIEKNPDYEQSPTKHDGYRTVFTHPFTFRKDSYLAIPYNVINNSNISAEPLLVLEAHFKDLKARGISADKLAQRGYQTVLWQAFNMYWQDMKMMQPALENDAKILASLRDKGMRVYHESTMNLLREYTIAKQLTPLSQLVDYASKNFLILNLKLYLDDNDGKNKVSGATQG